MAISFSQLDTMPKVQAVLTATKSTVSNLETSVNGLENMASTIINQQLENAKQQVEDFLKFITPE